MADEPVRENPPGAAEIFSTWNSSDSADADRVAVEQLEEVSWARPLLTNLDNARKSGDPGQERAFLWEARVAYSIHRLGWQAQYEFKAGEGDQSIDFRVMSRPELLIEAIAIQNSAASERAGWVEEPMPGATAFGICLTSTNRDQRQTTAGEMVHLVELLTGKASKFPLPRPGVYHLLVADIRGYNAGVVDHDDCDQIAWGPTATKDYARQFFGTIPVHGVFDPANTHPKAERSRQRLHAIGLFCRQRSGSEDVLGAPGSIYRRNRLLITTKEEELITSLLERELSGQWDR
jgi:hypothetical protein